METVLSFIHKFESDPQCPGAQIILCLGLCLIDYSFYTFEDKEWWGINIDALSANVLENDLYVAVKRHIQCKNDQEARCLKYL